AGRHAGAAADAGRGVERAVGVRLRDRVGVGVRCGTRGGADIAARLDDAVERSAVDDQVLDDREGAGPPRLHGDGVAVVEAAHVQLAGGRALRTVRLSVDHDTTGAADALAAVVVE